MCTKLDSLDERYISISNKKIKEQFAEILISMASNAGHSSDGNVLISSSVKDIAGILGTSIEYLYKVLLEFTKKNIVSFHKHKLTILNLNVLTQIANGKKEERTLPQVHPF